MRLTSTVRSRVPRERGSAGVVTLLALVGCASAAAEPVICCEKPVDHYEMDWAERVRPWSRRPVVAVTTRHVGLGESARDPLSEPEACATFQPTARQIRRFFAKGKRVSKVGYVRNADWSACHATGDLQLKGGKTATWLVQRLGAGYLQMDDARYYFDCPACGLEGAK